MLTRYAQVCKVLRMTQLPAFLTPREAADALTAAGIRTTDDSIRRWIRKGKLAGIKTPGGATHVRRTDIEAILNAGDPVAAAR